MLGQRHSAMVKGKADGLCPDAKLSTSAKTQCQLAQKDNGNRYPNVSQRHYGNLIGQLD